MAKTLKVFVKPGCEWQGFKEGDEIPLFQCHGGQGVDFIRDFGAIAEAKEVESADAPVVQKEPTTKS